MYKIWMGFILIVLFSGCSGKATIVDGMQTSKSYCRSNGGSWNWNSDFSKWECKGFDISSFEKEKKQVRKQYVSKSYCKRLGGNWIWDGSINKWKCEGINISDSDINSLVEEDRIALLNEKKEKIRDEKRLKRCLTGSNKIFTHDDELNVVIDHCRNLMWQDRSWEDWEAVRGGSIRGSKEDDHGDSINYCRHDVITGNYSNWRLPTMNELRSIVDVNYQPAINKVFKNGISKKVNAKGSLFYWSSEANNYRGKGIRFKDGSSSSLSTTRGFYRESGLIRCVRDIPLDDKIFKIQKARKTKIIGSKNFQNVKFINGVLWEDQAYNKRLGVDYDSCKRHCNSLTLLGIDKWEIPSKKQFNQIKTTSYKKLDYVIGTPDKYNIGSYTPIRYFTRDKCGYGSVYGLQVSSDYDCIKKNDSYARVCRCALDVKTYNASKKDKLNGLESQSSARDFNFYLNKFNLSDDIEALKKAESFATTLKDKAKIEKAYIEFIGDYWKVFKLDTNSIPGDHQRDGEIDLVIFKGFSKIKNLRYKINLSKNKKSPVPLKYGNYKIDVDFTLTVKYNDTVRLGNLAHVTPKTKVLHKRVTFKLNRQNGYTMNKTIDFGQFVAATRTEFMRFADLRSKVTGAVLKSKISDIKLP